MRTATEYRQMAKESRQRSAESFERCDTDGFLSQWASDQMARRYDVLAEVADNDYQWSFPALFDLEGNVVDARYVETRYGFAWVMDTPDGTKWFNPSGAMKGATRRRNDEKKGFRVGRIMAPVKIDKHERFYQDMDGEVTVVSDGTNDYPDW